MPDVLGYRGKWGLVLPARNTVVEPELYAMVPPGITLHTSRIYIGRDVTFRNDAEFEALVAMLEASLPRALEDVSVCQPDYLIIGISSESFWGGRAAARAYIDRIRRQTGVEVTTAGNAVPAALSALGVGSVGVITPYQAVADGQVRGFLEECGFAVPAIHGLRLETGIQIAQQTADTLRRAIGLVNEANPDAILQVGTNLPVARLIGDLERELGKPVLSINATLLWHALRANGIDDRIPGYGRLLTQH